MANKNSKKFFLFFNCNFDFCILIFTFIRFCIFLTIILSFPKFVFSSEPNNKFGIHLAQPHFDDLKKAAEMVNSSGGDWGYITLVIEENDRNKQKWQEIFDLMRELHLIPIIRMATSPQGENWRRPSINDVESWVDFLDSLNWVIKNRYVILFNEPNHATEWEGEVDPKSYAEIAYSFAKALKEKNPDFFVMLAGFDASAPHQPPKFWDEVIFLKEILNIKSDIFNYLDGWVSHSYPNPNFSGSPWDNGRGTVKTYQWELELLKSLGVNKNLPVFITETGWEKKLKNQNFSVKNYLNEEIVAEYFRIAFENIWLPDKRVVAITPFVFNYQSEPFLGFSFKKQNSNEFYQQYYRLKEITKIAGEPLQIEKGEINFFLPKKLVAGSSYNFKITLKNQGQAIWEKRNYQLILEKVDNRNQENWFSYVFADLPKIPPEEEVDLNFFFKTNSFDLSQKRHLILKFLLNRKEKKILESKEWQFDIIPPPSLKFEVIAFPRIRVQDYNNYEIQIFDKNENLIFKKKPVRVKNKIGILSGVENVVLGEKYRVVILRPYYLPRQNFVVFKEGENFLRFKTMLPLDFNLDGKFDFSDIRALGTKIFPLLGVKNPN